MGLRVLGLGGFGIYKVFWGFWGLGSLVVLGLGSLVFLGFTDFGGLGSLGIWRLRGSVAPEVLIFQVLRGFGGLLTLRVRKK